MGDSDDDVDKDFDDDDDDEEEEQQQKGKKRKLNPFVRDFILSEADVDEDGEEEGDDDEDLDDDLIEVEEAKSAAATAEARRAARQQMAKNLADDEDLDLNEEALNQRYSGYMSKEDADDLQGYEETSAIRQQSLHPTPKDPKLWMVPCKLGKERETVISLLQKFIDKEDGERLFIKSAVAPPHLKGFIYVEAERVAHVKKAVHGLRNLTEWKLQMVPLKQMVEVLSVPNKEFMLSKNSWVRVKRGTYKGDIAQVVEADESKGRVFIKLIPRLDLYGKKEEEKEIEQKDQDEDAEGNPVPKKGVKRKARVRPAPRFFNPDEVKALGKDIQRTKRDAHGLESYWVFEGNRFKDGYLYKFVTLKILDVTGVSPTIDEVTKFQSNKADAGDEEEDLDALAKAKSRKKIQLARGDVVKVVEGALKKLTGVIESVDENDNVTVRPKLEGLRDLLSFPISHLQKFFKEGDHCKVVNGRFDGETGFVIRVDDHIVTLFSDLTQRELKVLAADLQLCSEATTGKIELGNYELHDLVYIDAHTVGIIVKIERDSFKILDNNGSVRTVRLQEIGSKRHDRNAQAFDSHNNSVAVGDIIQVSDGKNKGRQGTIKHIFRFFLFLHSRMVNENGGIFVEKATNVQLLGGNKKKLGSNSSFVPQSPGSFAPQSPFRTPGMGDRGRGRGRGDRGGRGGPGAGRGRGRGGREDPMLHKTVSITGGAWKGYIGIVVETTDTTARIELHTNCKTVSVEKNKLVVAGDKGTSLGGAPIRSNFGQRPSGNLWDAAGARTPNPDISAVTPMHVGTPMHHGMSTPLRNDWENTPMRPDTPGWGEEVGGWTPGPYAPYSPFTPFDHTATPHDHHNPQTPTGYPETPGNYDAGTPHPEGTTPGAFPRTPQTPGTPYHAPDVEEREKEKETAVVWYIPDVEVLFKEGTSEAGKKGVIKEVNGLSNITVNVLTDDYEESGRLVTVSADNIEHVLPQKKDQVHILRGEFKGHRGSVNGVYRTDFIVRVEQTLQVKVLDVNDIVKIYSPNANEAEP